MLTNVKCIGVCVGFVVLLGIFIRLFGDTNVREMPERLATAPRRAAKGLPVVIGAVLVGILIIAVRRGLLG